MLITFKRFELATLASYKIVGILAQERKPFIDGEVEFSLLFQLRKIIFNLWAKTKNKKGISQKKKNLSWAHWYMAATLGTTVAEAGCPHSPAPCETSLCLRMKDKVIERKQDIAQW